MLSDLFSFGAQLLSNWIGGVGLLSTLLWIWAEVSNKPERGFLGNRKLWGRLAIVFLFAACFQAWRDEHAASENARVAGRKFAMVSSDGVILSQRGFSDYGLTVEKRQGSRADGATWPEYILKFEHEPEYFDVRSIEGYTPQRTRLGPGQYRFVFVHPGFGSPMVEANSRIEAE